MAEALVQAQGQARCLITLVAENIKDVPKRLKIPEAYCVEAQRGGSWDWACGGGGARVECGCSSGSNYVAVSILSHLTAAWNTHHSSLQPHRAQINSRADKGRARQHTQWQGPPSHISKHQRNSFCSCPPPLSPGQDHGLAAPILKDKTSKSQETETLGPMAPCANTKG